MSENRTRGRLASQRAFRPTLDGQLESRFLLSGAARPAALHAAPAHRVQIQNANGGRSVIITDSDRAQFEVTLTSSLQVSTQPQITVGTVRARPMSGGRVALTVFGTTADSILAINPVIKSALTGAAHDFAAGQAANDGLLHVGKIRVITGKINSILGYHSADLSGPIAALATTPVNRIAFQAILPGASIAVGGDLDTLDVLTTLNVSGGPGITVGRDLNWIDTGGNLILNDGSSLVVGRDIGLVAQPAKGTGPAGQGGFVLGNLVIGTGSQMVIGRSLAAPFVVDGNGTGLSQVVVGTPLNTFVFRPGAIVTP
jgi:hypothetical protein